MLSEGKSARSRQNNWKTIRRFDFCLIGHTTYSRSDVKEGWHVHGSDKCPIIFKTFLHFAFPVNKLNVPAEAARCSLPPHVHAANRRARGGVKYEWQDWCCASTKQGSLEEEKHIKETCVGELWNISVLYFYFYFILHLLLCVFYLHHIGFMLIFLIYLSYLLGVVLCRCTGLVHILQHSTGLCGCRHFFRQFGPIKNNSGTFSVWAWPVSPSPIPPPSYDHISSPQSSFQWHHTLTACVVFNRSWHTVDRRSLLKHLL